MTADEIHRFEALIRAGRGGGAAVDVPFSAKDVFGTGGQVRVVATFDGHEYRGSIAPMGGGVHVLGVRKDVRASICKDVGDTVQVTMRRDTEPRTVAVPMELSAVLARNREAEANFEALSYTHRKEYAVWVAEAKKQETRDRRAAKAVDMLLAGETR